MLKFKEYLIENPELETSDSRRFVGSMTKPIRDFMKTNHNKSEKIGESDKGTYHKVEFPGNRIGYYHYVSGNPREISIIKDNTQYVVSKGENGNSEHNKWMMKNHANNYGELKTYDTNSKGSKKLWKDLTKETDSKFSYYHHDGKSENKIEDVDNQENKIWGKGNSFRNQKIIMRKNV